MKRFVLRLLVSITTLAVIIICLAGFLLGTESGTVWTLRQLQSRAPELFEVKSIQGHFLNRLILTDLRLSLGVGWTEIDQFVLDWSPGALINREVLISELKAENLRFIGNPVPDDTASESLTFPIELPPLSLPVKLRVKRFMITDAAVRTSPETEPLIIETAKLAAHWDDAGITLERLEVRTPSRSLAVQGRIDPADSFAISLENRMGLELEGTTSITLTGNIEGNAEHLEIVQRATGHARLKLAGSITSPLTDPEWVTELQVEEIPGRLFDDQLPLVINGRLDASGNMHRIKLSAALASDSESGVAYDLDAFLDLDLDLSRAYLALGRLEVRHREQPSRISFSGAIASDRTLDLKGDWVGLQWPIVEEPLFRSQRGQVSIDGTLDDYRINLETQVHGQHLPEGSWFVSGSGNLEKMKLEDLKGELLGGELILRGIVAWAPQLRWDLETQVRNINPEGLSPDLSGSVNVDAITNGTMTDEGPEASLTIEGIEGDLNGFPLAGAGRLFYGAERIELERLNLRSGDAFLGVGGAIDEHSDLQWELQVPRLRQFLANASGSLSSQGSVRGRRMTPHVEGTIRLSGGSESAGGPNGSFDIDLFLDLDADLVGESLVVNRLELIQGKGPGRILLAGDMVADLSLNLAAEWEALQWPPVVEPLFHSQSGQITIKGNLNDYRLEMDTHFEGKDLPGGKWSLTGSGNLEQLQLETLAGELLDGQLTLKGEVGWAPQVKWNLETRARGLKPEGALPELSGLVNMDALTQGRLTDRGLESMLELEKLGGELNGFPLAGTGRVAYSNDRIQIEQFAINSGDAALVVSGVIGAQSDLHWDLQVPRLNQLLVDAAGSLSSKGSLRGQQTSPRIQGNLIAKELSVRTLGIERLAADVDLDLSENRILSMSVNGTGLEFGDQKVKRLDLEADGPLQDHGLKLVASHPEAKLQIRLQGGYSDEQWSGRLDEFEIASKQMGRWQLQQPADMLLAANRAKTGSFCLKRDAARICAESEWQAVGQSKLRFELTGLPLNWLKSHLPPEIRELGGEVTAEGQVSQGGSLKADIEAAVTPGELIFTDAGRDFRLSHKGAKLQFNAAEQGATGSLKAGVGTSTLELEFSLPDLLRDTDYLQSRISGSLRFLAPDLAVVPFLVPQVRAVEGSSEMKLDFSGMLGQPDVRGGGRLIVSRLDLPEVGLRLSNTNLDLGVSGNRLRLSGKLESGGSIDIDGDMELSAEKHWPLAINIEGKEFLAADLPNLQVVVSPKLRIEKGRNAFTLTGEVAVPKAVIIVRDLPAGARRASNDVIVVREDNPSDEATGVTAPLQMNVNLILGEEVRVSALGLQAFMRGELGLLARPGQSLLANGDIRIHNGTFRAYSQDLEITRGIISYTNSPLDNPGLNIQATRTIGDVVVGINALGTARRTTITTFSTPSMSENDRISYLVTGSPAGQGARLSLNRQINQNVSVGVSRDTQTGDSALVTRYRINRSFHTEVTSGARGGTLDLFYTIERE